MSPAIGSSFNEPIWTRFHLNENLSRFERIYLFIINSPSQHFRKDGEMKKPDCLPLYSDPELYDAQQWNYRDDIPFYVDRALKAGSPVLEIACGSGRITIPLAEAGLETVGLDISEDMLAHARRKAVDKKIKIEFLRADCRDFELGRKFKITIFPFNAIAHLHTREDIRQTLTCICRHLDASGYFVLDMINPDLDMLRRDPKKRHFCKEFPGPGGNGMVHLSESPRYEAAEQISYIKWYYRFSETGREIQRDLNMRIIFPQELDALLEYNGFEIESKYGWFDCSPFTSNAKRQIIVSRKRQSDDIA